MNKQSFSNRMGLVVEKAIQTNSMDRKLRTSIWNIIYTFFEDVIEDYDARWYLQNHIWRYFYVLPRDEMLDNAFNDLTKEFILKKDWNLVYDLVQEIIKYFFENFDYLYEAIKKNFNDEFENNNSGYRIVEKLVIPISNQIEIGEIEEVFDNSKDKFEGVYTHISTSLQYLSDRENPSYRNSIKESISAVESLCQKICGDDSATLGKALKKIETETGVELHTSLKKGYEKIYGYTADGDGIRHALLEKDTLTFEDAKYMLVSCSAFINYLIVKADKAEIFTE
jgi:hypothetical protein